MALVIRFPDDHGLPAYRTTVVRQDPRIYAEFVESVSAVWKKRDLVADCRVLTDSAENRRVFGLVARQRVEFLQVQPFVLTRCSVHFLQQRYFGKDRLQCRWRRRSVKSRFIFFRRCRRASLCLVIDLFFHWHWIQDYSAVPCLGATHRTPPFPDNGCRKTGIHRELLTAMPTPFANRTKRFHLVFYFKCCFCLEKKASEKFPTIYIFYILLSFSQFVTTTALHSGQELFLLSQGIMHAL